MINEIVSVGDEITQFQLILGQLTSDQIRVRYPFNYRIPDQEIWIVGGKERLSTFVLVSVITNLTRDGSVDRQLKDHQKW